MVISCLLSVFITAISLALLLILHLVLMADFTVLPEDVAISAGDPICLYCGYPGSNSEEWLKDGMTVDMDPAPCNCFLNVTGNLTALCFNAFDSGDAGQYTCTVNGTTCTANATVLLASK